MAPIYQYNPIPTSDESLPEAPEVNDPNPKAAFKLEQAKAKLRKRRAFHFIFISVVLFSMALISKQFLSSKGALKDCRAFNRNMTSVKLPSHYTLPSGDKIPAVGLGMS